MTATANQGATEDVVPPRRQRTAVITAGFGQNIVLTTVSTIETLTMGMSRKVWQKIFVLNEGRMTPDAMS